MIYTCSYDSPLGKIKLSCDDKGLTGLCFAQSEKTDNHHFLLDEAVEWLNIYFSGGIPDFTPALNLNGTAFQLRVWECLRQIPYGHTAAYKAIAQELSCGSSQAVGQAVAHNPILIIIPCHRVIASDGSFTGYAGGLERKAALLNLERVNAKK